MGWRMKRTVVSLVALLAFGQLGIAHLARADSETDQAVQKTLKTLVGSIRYGKDDTAAKQLAFTAMGKELLADDWSNLTPAEQSEVGHGLETVIRAASFAKGRDMFKYLDALLFEPARVSGDRAQVKSTIVVHRELKKTEVIIDWVLIKDGGSWKVLDTVMLGESTLKGLRDDQVVPLLKQGGTAAVLKALRDKVATVQKT